MYDLSNYNTLFYIKIPIIKGQLTAGVLMFVSTVVYIVIFIVTVYRMSKTFQVNPIPLNPSHTNLTAPSYPLQPNTNYVNMYDTNPRIQAYVPYQAAQPSIPYTAVQPYVPYQAPQPSIPYTAVQPYAHYQAPQPYAPYIAVQPYAPYQAVQPYAPYSVAQPSAPYPAVQPYYYPATNQVPPPSYNLPLPIAYPYQ